MCVLTYYRIKAFSVSIMNWYALCQFKEIEKILFMLKHVYVSFHPYHTRNAAIYICLMSYPCSGF